MGTVDFGEILVQTMKQPAVGFKRDSLIPTSTCSKIAGLTLEVDLETGYIYSCHLAII